MVIIFVYVSVYTIQRIISSITEVLRLHPIVPVIDRACTNPLKLPKFKLELRKGDKVLCPIYAFHQDPQYFPDPDRFDPERFNQSNRHNIKPFTYLPFGSGPRNCIGNTSS
jgi:cytochrome P450